MDLQAKIKAANENINAGRPISAEQRQAVLDTIGALDRGEIRVAEKTQSGEWQTNAWVKGAILHYFRTQEMECTEVGPYVYNDKIPLKSNYTDLGVRVVPPATARYGSFMEKDVVLMPCYVNIGAYIGSQSMVDTWATVGSCAQIGSQVHLAGGVGIGGVLEPAGAQPVIIGDGAFIGSRAIIVEGVHVDNEAVIAANVSLTASTPIIDIRPESEGKITNGYIPPRAVVVPGTQKKVIESGGKSHEIFVACAYIIGERKESTDRKTSLNQALRQYSL